jgi:hypothetical protein
MVSSTGENVHRLLVVAFNYIKNRNITALKKITNQALHFAPLRLRNPPDAKAQPTQSRPARPFITPTTQLTTEHPQMQCRLQPCTCSPQSDRQKHNQTAQQRPPIAPFASLRYAFISLRR